MQGKEEDAVQNRMKFVKKEKRKRDGKQKEDGETDVFWNKKNNPKNNKQDDNDF
jgi:hypothetical protein